MKYVRQVDVYQHRQRKGILKTSKIFVDMLYKIYLEFCENKCGYLYNLVDNNVSFILLSWDGYQKTYCYWILHYLHITFFLPQASSETKKF